jgi:hypothetical protein
MLRSDEALQKKSMACEENCCEKESANATGTE